LESVFRVPGLGLAVAGDRLHRELHRGAVAEAILVGRGEVAEDPAADLVAGGDHADGLGHEHAPARFDRDAAVEGDDPLGGRCGVACCR